MFSKAHVDGMTSFMPGAATNVNEVVYEEDEEL
jgi:hypothetical protein